MKKYIKAAFFLVVLGAFAGSDAEAAPCAPGLENVAGTCVTAGLSASMRERGVLMNQLKIGYNLPIAPKKDNLYPRNFDVSRFEFSQFGNFSVETFPPSP
jgi:hypothetical protein